MDSYLYESARAKSPRRRPAPGPAELDLFAGVESGADSGSIEGGLNGDAVPVGWPPIPQPSDLDSHTRSRIEEYVPEAPTDSPVFRELVEIAQDRLLRCGEYGSTIGEVVAQYERSGRRVGGVKMEDKIKEQRQTSWLPRVMWAADAKPSKYKRPSPLKRHHHKEQRVWVSSAVARKGAA